MDKKIKSINFFYRSENKKAVFWKKKIILWLKKNYPLLKVTNKKPGAIIVLGGDGTVLTATRHYQKLNTLILGLNLGQVGFLTAVREEKNFFPALEKFLKGDYLIVEKMTLQAKIKRNKKIIFETFALNDIVVTNPLGLVKIEVMITGYPFQHVQGTGILVATPTGSTAYNLSAHGPIVSPDINCLIVTEILDHNIPTPSIVLKPEETVSLKISSFREHNLLAMKSTGKKAEVIMVADGQKIFPLVAKDVIQISRLPYSVKFAEIEEKYFLKSLREKFAFD
ncbi:MAG: NAD(+)/NADH kinase [Patescibacteria group bacterium]